MSKVDYETYTNLFESMVMTPYFPHPNLLIYLEGSLDVINRRVQERGRSMEKNTPFSYWEEMYTRYSNWINNFNSCSVLRIDITEYDLMYQNNSIEIILYKISVALQAN